MASSILFYYTLLAFVLFHPLLALVAGGEIILEDGYAVSTVLVGDKSSVKVNPHSILHQSQPSDLFVLLDSLASTFYTVSIPTTSGDVEVQRLAGNGREGYADGDLGSATFNKPKSFAVDFNGNVYVADQSNHVIRKITKSGVTTIAGGYSQKIGSVDGPAQNASFSGSFLLTFVPERCALMIADHGSRLVRQINLKAEDCTLHSGSVLTSTSLWILGLGLSCIFGLIVGFVIRPYIIPYEGIKPLRTNWTWTCCLMNLERPTVMLCFVSKSATVKTALIFLSRQVLTLVLFLASLVYSRPNKSKARNTNEKSVSLMDLDVACNHSSIADSPEVESQLKDLLIHNGVLSLPVNVHNVTEQENCSNHSDVSSTKPESIDDMILENLASFGSQARGSHSREPLECSSMGLVKRR